MSKVLKLAENIEILRDANKRLDLSIIDPKEASRITTELDRIAEYFLTCIKFEEGFDPDRDSE
jgi:hypothetical protein